MYTNTNFKETIIIGAGPSGLQLGYFFNKINQDYIILEKANVSASFFDKYPHTKELISINKPFTGSKNKDFNLRHDWNSLLNNYELEMKQYTEEYFPSREDLFKYLNDFSIHHNIKIQYNTNIINIKKKNNLFYIKSDTNTIWTCKELIIATGLSKFNMPSIGNIEKYSKHYGEYPKDYFLQKNNLDKYKNKKVLIIGQGNSAFELANTLNSVCSNVIILGRNHTPKPSICTHYVGDVRAKYLSFYDTFFLKSLNAFEATDRKINIIKENNLFYITSDEIKYQANIGFYEVINCTGWKFDDSMFDETLKPALHDEQKYPMINGMYESYNIPNLFFIGALMHSFDFKKSSGGFIHGFRYLIVNFVKINYTSFQPLLCNNIDDLSFHFSKRINTSSALYQMHGQLCDVFYKMDQYYIYFEQVPLSYIFTMLNTKIYIPLTHIFILTLEYGTKIESDLKDLGKSVSGIGNESQAILLHPVIRVYNNIYDTFVGCNPTFEPTYLNLKHISGLTDIQHFDEELLTNFKSKKIYYDKFKRIVKSYD